jgi:hypothetical protein
MLVKIKAGLASTPGREPGRSIRTNRSGGTSRRDPSNLQPQFSQNSRQVPSQIPSQIQSQIPSQVNQNSNAFVKKSDIESPRKVGAVG